MVSTVKGSEIEKIVNKLQFYEQALLTIHGFPPSLRQIPAFWKGGSNLDRGGVPFVNFT